MLENLMNFHPETRTDVWGNCNSFFCATVKRLQIRWIFFISLPSSNLSNEILMIDKNSICGFSYTEKWDTQIARVQHLIEETNTKPMNEFEYLHNNNFEKVNLTWMKLMTYARMLKCSFNEIQRIYGCLNEDIFHQPMRQNPFSQKILSLCRLIQGHINTLLTTLKLAYFFGRQ